MPAPDPVPPTPSTVDSPPPAGEDALHEALIGALDHDLRTSLTTVLGTLQTLARPGPAPADPDLEQLLASAVAQARHMGRLLDELPAAASPSGRRHLSPTDLALLIREAAHAAEVADLRLHLVDEFPGTDVSAPGLRRVLTGIFARTRGSAALRVVVANHDADCHIAISGTADQKLMAPGFVAPLLAAMGGRLETTVTAGAPALLIVLPGSVGGGD